MKHIRVKGRLIDISREGASLSKGVAWYSCRFEAQLPDGERLETMPLTVKAMWGDRPIDLVLEPMWKEIMSGITYPAGVYAKGVLYVDHGSEVVVNIGADLVIEWGEVDDTRPPDDEKG